jgi:hypothetical protein
MSKYTRNANVMLNRKQSHIVEVLHGFLNSACDALLKGKNI